MDKLKPQGNYIYLFGSFCFSVCTVFMTRMVFKSGGVWGTIEENYFNPFGISAFILFLFCIPVFYIILILIDLLFQKCLSQIYAEETIDNKSRIVKFWGIMIAVAWLPYYLSYYPGGIYVDTFTSIKYYMSGVLTNRHPFLYNTLIGFAIRIGQIFDKDLTWSMGLFLAVQMIALEAEIIYFLNWMLIRQINRSVRTVIMIFFCFFPLIPFYGISVWKDTPFCMSILLWSMFLTDLYLNIQKNIWNTRVLLKFILAMFLVAFTRNNGIYVIIFSMIVFVITSYKKIFIKKRIIYLGMLSAIIAIIFIQGPVYRLCGISQTDFVENLGIPLQQIGAVVAYDGNITEEQKESLDRFFSYEKIKEQYHPGIADSLKWSADLDSEYLSEHTLEFLTLWLNLLIQNPKICIKGYLLATAGFWNVDVSLGGAYVQNYVWDNEYELSQMDYFEKWFGFAFQHFVNPRYYISSAWFFWIFLVVLLFSMKRYGWRKSYLFTPQMGVWLTIMIATPLAMSLRYSAPLLFTMPFAVILPMLLERENSRIAYRERAV